jgi:accessory gene regulator protein AgrB
MKEFWKRYDRRIAVGALLVLATVILFSQSQNKVMLVGVYLVSAGILVLVEIAGGNSQLRP